MTLVTLTYQDKEQEKITRLEVVDSAGQRFVELISSGVLNIDLAKENAELGLVRSIKKLNFVEGKEKREIDVTYTTNDDRIHIDGFKNFTIRGFNVKVGNSEYGNVLSLDLVKPQVTLIKRSEANDMVYAIKAIQEFNTELVEELTGKNPDEIVEEKDDENAE